MGCFSSWLASATFATHAACQQTANYNSKPQQPFVQRVTFLEGRGGCLALECATAALLEDGPQAQHSLQVSPFIYVCLLT